ncbi:hypothetical protein U1Q18_047538 [Sarracenia purpurea var. burkii]
MADGGHLKMKNGWIQGQQSGFEDSCISSLLHNLIIWFQDLLFRIPFHGEFSVRAVVQLANLKPTQLCSEEVNIEVKVGFKLEIFYVSNKVKEYKKEQTDGTTHSFNIKIDCDVRADEVWRAFEFISIKLHESFEDPLRSSFMMPFDSELVFKLKNGLEKKQIVRIDLCSNDLKFVVSINTSYEKPDKVGENVSASSSIVLDETQVDTSQPVDDGGFIENDSIRPLDDEGDFTEQDDNAGVSEPSEESQPDNEGIET